MGMSNGFISHFISLCVVFSKNMKKGVRGETFEQNFDTTDDGHQTHILWRRSCHKISNEQVLHGSVVPAGLNWE
jgi:hypothetical protein